MGAVLLSSVQHKSQRLSIKASPARCVLLCSSSAMIAAFCALQSGGCSLCSHTCQAAGTSFSIFLSPFSFPFPFPLSFPLLLFLSLFHFLVLPSMALSIILLQVHINVQLCVLWETSIFHRVKTNISLLPLI